MSNAAEMSRLRASTPPSVGPATRSVSRPAARRRQARGARTSGWVAGCLLAGVVAAHAQSTFLPPEALTYQGYLVDSQGAEMGATTPTNKVVSFRLYTASTGGTALWGESQTVTFDKGQFSVLLGLGGAIAGAGAPPHGLLSTNFASASASERYLGMTLAGGTEIQPRLRLVTSPFSFLARYATELVGAGGQGVLKVDSALNVGIGTNTPQARLHVVGEVRATSFTGNGSGITNLALGSTTTGSLADGRLSSNVPLLDRNSQVFTGTKNTFKNVEAKDVTVTNLTASTEVKASDITATGTVTANTLVGFGTVPIGGIIMWSGAIADIPSGWGLCDGGTKNGRTTPDLRSRFIIGAGEGSTGLAAGLSAYAVGTNKVSEAVTLTTGHLPAHTHNYTDRYTDGTVRILGQGAFNNFNIDTGLVAETKATTSTGSATPTPVDVRPSFYALAFIMRTK